MAIAAELKPSGVRANVVCPGAKTRLSTGAAVGVAILAAVLFMVPLAIAVAALSVKYPGTGGLYLWARNDFGRFHGFLCFAIYWIGLAIWFPSAAMSYMSVAVYTLGPSYAHLADSRLYLVTASLAAIWIALGTNLIGLRIGKWTQNILTLLKVAGLAVIILVALTIVAISSSESDTSFVKWRTPTFLSTYQGGISRRATFSLIDLAQGRASS